MKACSYACILFYSARTDHSILKESTTGNENKFSIASQLSKLPQFRSTENFGDTSAPFRDVDYLGVSRKYQLGRDLKGLPAGMHDEGEYVEYSPSETGPKEVIGRNTKNPETLIRSFTRNVVEDK